MSRLATFAACLLLGTPLAAQAPRHPLDPLSPEEITRAAEVIRATRRLTPEARFGMIALAEPDKARLAAGDSLRAAEALVFDWRRARGYRVVVDLRRGAVADWTDLPTHQPPVRAITIARLQEAAERDPRWAAALARRGLQPGDVALLYTGAERDTLRRRDGVQVADGGPFQRHAPPPEDGIPGLEVEVDLTNGRISRFQDSLVPPRTRQEPEVTRLLAAAPRIPAGTVPANPAITIAGNEIRWHRWRLRAGVHPRRGLELSDVRIEDGGRARPVVYRAGVAETIAPYGDRFFASWYPRDEGDYGLGSYGRTSAVPGADAPPGAHYLDAVVADPQGRPSVIPRAVAIYEVYDGVLWRHARDSRPAMKLVVSSFATIDNYDYVISWSFLDDGTIEHEVRLTGVMNMRRGRSEDDPAAPHGASAHPVSPVLYAPHHQHFFSYRLDLDVDGAANRVVEVNAEPLPVGPDNPSGEWFASRGTVITSESMSRRSLELRTGRRWRVESTAGRNPLGSRIGYTLVPGENAPPLQAEGAPARRRAEFIDAPLWVTAYSAREMYPSGDYPNIDPDHAGLPRWVAANRPLQDADVVLWYTLGVTHLPRPEDYPFMAAHRAGFRLVPTGFFVRNPALDAPRP